MKQNFTDYSQAVYASIKAGENKYKVKPSGKESSLQILVVNYIKLVSPHSVVVADPNGLRLSIGMAQQLKRMRAPENGGHPDLWIFEPRGIYHGLFIELKRENEKLFKAKTFDFKSEHISKQDEMHRKLRAKGYYGHFAIGFDQAKRLIDGYFKLETT